MKHSSYQQLEKFFAKRIFNIQSQHKLNLNEFIQLYITSLCVKAVRSENIFMFDSNGEVPLALSWGKAFKEASGFSRFKRLVDVGDRSLFVAGFFSDYFNRKVFDIDYYIQLGSIAYEQASDLQKKLSYEKDIKVFSDLAKNFKDIVFTMSELSSDVNLTSKKNVLALFDRWQATQNKYLLKELQKKGVVVFDLKEKIIH